MPVFISFPGTSGVDGIPPPQGRTGVRALGFPGPQDGHAGRPTGYRAQALDPMFHNLRNLITARGGGLSSLGYVHKFFSNPKRPSSGQNVVTDRSQPPPSGGSRRKKI